MSPTPAPSPRTRSIDPVSSPAVSVTGLRRTYRTDGRSFEAVRGVDLEVETGTITALLGTNGAGKTSTLEIIEGLSAPSAGTVRVLGLDPLADRDRLRRRTATLLQSSGFSGDLSVEETLTMWAATVTGSRPVAEALALLSLEPTAATRVKNLSGGERRRLDLACTLLGRPEVVFLDEPTTGLDPESRREVHQILRDLRTAGVTVVLCTHYLDEAEELADRVLIMSHGRIVRAGTVAEITASAPSTVSFRLADTAVELPALTGSQVRRVHGSVQVTTDDLQRTLGDLLSWAGRHDLRLERLDARTGSLESVFLEVADDPDDPSTPTHPDPEDA